MTLSQLSAKNWSTPAAMPKLNSNEWNMTGLLGIVLLVMAVTQLIGFSDFKSWLSTIELGGPTAWAVGLIIAEVWAAATFFKIRLSSAFRMVGGGLAILVAGFWFVQNLQLIAGGAAGRLSSSGYFGKYLMQSPGWWSAIEATVFLLWTLYAVDLTKNSK